ncbi:signal peptidase complex-like protein DTM1 [Lycium ferocissimum]|uniref:signal peptidase complex-like protein DTM1 n=1 Tax=Lycium ferocissimum TaxID=112874 RepID=UPI002814D3DA|nr:signal peptidase complex-like protein DTM1 [Lycium ferocissimum]
MNNVDRNFQLSVACLATIIVFIGLYTQSLQKMVVTYFIGMLGIIGVLSPDWESFDQSVSQWCNPLKVDNLTFESDTSTRFRFYPVRVAIFTIVYGFVLYKWWMFISSE